MSSCYDENEMTIQMQDLINIKTNPREYGIDSFFPTCIKKMQKDVVMFKCASGEAYEKWYSENFCVEYPFKKRHKHQSNQWKYEIEFASFFAGFIRTFGSNVQMRNKIPYRYQKAFQGWLDSSKGFSYG